MRRMQSSSAQNRASVGAQGAVAILTSALAVLGFVSQADAQAKTAPRTRQISFDRDENRKLLDDLGNSFNDDPRRFTPERKPMMPANPTTPTDAMRAVRPLVRQFAEDTAVLVNELFDLLPRVPSLRPLYTDSMKVSQLAVTLEKHALKYNDHRFLLDEFQELDASWREFAYRLQNIRTLPADVRQLVTELNDLDEQMRDSIGMRPQVNRRDLSQKAYDLAQDLKILTEDVREELGASKPGQQYQIALSKARQEIRSLAALLEDDTVDLDMIVDGYKQFQTVWYPQRLKLQDEDNPYFERSLRRITTTDGEIHQLLLLPTAVDSQQLIYLTTALRKNIDEFFDRMSLRLLMHLPKSERVAGAASEFYGVCEHFIDEVNQGVDHDQLVDSFQYIEDAQRSFSSVFGDLESDEALTALAKIEQTIDTLRLSLNIERNDFNRQAAIDLIASVETYSDQLELAAKRWLNRDRQSFANACLQQIATMRDQTQQLHIDMVRGASLPTLSTEVEDLYDTWRSVYNYLIKCQTEDRPTLGRLSSRITPALVELRTTLAH